MTNREISEGVACMTNREISEGVACMTSKERLVKELLV